MPRPVLVSEPVYAPVPKTVRSGVIRNEVFALLEAMTLEAARDVNRNRRSIEQYIYEFRKRFGKERRFITREIKPGWSRLWRIN